MKEIPANSVVLFYPYPTLYYNHAMLDQAVGGYHYKIIGGEGLEGNAQGVNVGIQPLTPLALPSVFIRSFFVPPRPTGSVTPLNIKLPDEPSLTKATITQFREYVVRNHVATLVIEDSTSAPSQLVLPYLTAAFGAPSRHDHGTLFVWTHTQLARADAGVR